MLTKIWFRSTISELWDTARTESRRCVKPADIPPWRTTVAAVTAAVHEQSPTGTQEDRLHGLGARRTGQPRRRPLLRQRQSRLRPRARSPYHLPLTRSGGESCHGSCDGSRRRTASKRFARPTSEPTSRGRQTKRLHFGSSTRSALRWRNSPSDTSDSRARSRRGWSVSVFWNESLLNRCEHGSARNRARIAPLRPECA